jgi:NADPH2:quinone reductase
MRYINMDGFGGPEVLQLADGPVPEVAVDEVLIRVAAAGVNRPDVVQRRGHYPPPPGASPVLGLEVAGEIVSVGDDVTHWRPGDRVCALVAGGGYAEYATAPAAQCLPIPAGLDALSAAALPETCFTVWHNVFERGALREQETLLVHGGSSGIGTTAIQLAAARGHRVFATAGSTEKCRVCEQLGAERAIPYREQDFVEVVRELTGGRGVDVILDMVGGDYLPRNVACAAADGRIVNIAFLQGSRVELDFLPVMLKRLTLTGSTLRAREASFKAALAGSVQREIWPLLEAGRMAPHIHSVLPLEQAGAAHELMESSAHVGKIVLQVAPEAAAAG